MAQVNRETTISMLQAIMSIQQIDAAVIVKLSTISGLKSLEQFGITVSMPAKNASQQQFFVCFICMIAYVQILLQLVKCVF